MKELVLYITDNEKLSIRKQCELLDINRSNVYYKSVVESDENLKIMRIMDEHYLVHPTYGVSSDTGLFISMWIYSQS